MRTPPHVVVFRVVTVAITLLVLLGLGLGLAGQGPFAGLAAQATQAATGQSLARYPAESAW